MTMLVIAGCSVGTPLLIVIGRGLHAVDYLSMRKDIGTGMELPNQPVAKTWDFTAGWTRPTVFVPGKLPRRPVVWMKSTTKLSSIFSTWFGVSFLRQHKINRGAGKYLVPGKLNHCSFIRASLSSPRFSVEVSNCLGVRSWPDFTSWALNISVCNRKIDSVTSGLVRLYTPVMRCLPVP